jgi:hypothetical protein
LLTVLVAAPASGGGGTGAVAVAPGGTITVEAALDVGAPVERAVRGRAYALAVAKDGQERWTEAAVLYQQAVAEWTAALRARPSPALERAVQKADRERQRSQMLAGLERARARNDATVSRMGPLDEARLYRTKLMVVRAFTGTVPAALYARARNAFEEALRSGNGNVAAAGTIIVGPVGAPPRPGTQAEINLLLCATHAAAGDPAAARLARARVPDAERADPANALAMAVCAAALGEHEQALGRLEVFVLRPPPHHADAYVLRDLYVANDWDRMRGSPRFESLFR